MKQLKLYQVEMKYVRNLHNADDRVESVTPQIGKANRVFIGEKNVIEISETSVQELLPSWSCVETQFLEKGLDQILIFVMIVVRKKRNCKYTKR